MALFDIISDMFGGKKKTSLDPTEMVKEATVGQLDSNDDGKLDVSDLDVNQDGSTDLKDLDAAKKKFNIN